MTMSRTYSMEIDTDAFSEEAVESIIGEIEEAIENIRKYHPSGDKATQDVDIDELLADHQAIAIIWDIQHVKAQRPDLGDEQAWEILQECQRCHHLLNDPMLETIRQVAENLYPRQRRERRDKAAEIIAGYGNGDERENLVDLLTDAMHWCEGFGEPFDEFCDTARVHFAEESKTSRKGA
jgi:hypothetical protein